MDIIYQLREFPVVSLNGNYDLLTVASGIVLIKDRKVLVVREFDEGLYSFPGGTCRNNESFEETAIRETMEELSLNVNVIGAPFMYVFQRYVDYKSEIVILFHYHVGSVYGVLKLANDAKQKRWVSISDDFSDCYPNVESATRYFLNQYGKNPGYEIKED